MLTYSHIKENNAIETLKAEAATLKEWAAHVNPSNMGSYLEQKAAERLRQLHHQVRK